MAKRRPGIKPRDNFHPYSVIVDFPFLIWLEMAFNELISLFFHSNCPM